MCSSDLTRKIQDFPVILMGSDYWRGLLDWIRGRLLADGMISPEDLELLTVTDDHAEAVQVLVEGYKRRRAEGLAQPEKADTK